MVDTAEAETLGDELRALTREARAALRAEGEFQAARASVAGGLLGRITGFAALALALGFFVLMVLAVGTLLGLTPLLGAWGAMAAVAGGLLVLALVAALMSLAGWRRLRRLFVGTGA